MTPVAYSCPHCQATVRSSAPVPAGEPIECPRCATVYPAPPAASPELRTGPPPAVIPTVVPVDVVRGAESRRAERVAPAKSGWRPLATALVVGAILVVSAVAGGGFTLLASLSPKPEQFQEFNSPEGRFTVQMPGTPK